MSGDIIGTEESALVTSQDTQVLGGHLLDCPGWCDNEWAFSRRCIEMMTRMV